MNNSNNRNTIAFRAKDFDHVVSYSSFSVEILGYDCRQKQGSD